MKRTKFLWLLSIVMLVASLFAFSACNKSDDAPTDATITITVIKDGKVQSGVPVYVFRQGSSSIIPANADKCVVTDASGVASVDLENVQGQENINFGVFSGSGTNAVCIGAVAATIKAGDDKTLIINVEDVKYGDEDAGIIDVTLTMGGKYVSGATLYLYDHNSFVNGFQSIEYAKYYGVTDNNGKAKYVTPEGIYELVYWKNSTLFYSQTVEVRKNNTATVSFNCKEETTVIVKHNSSSKYFVYIDNVQVAVWTAPGTYTFDVTPNVQHTLYIEQQDGYVFSATKGTKIFTLKEGETVTFSGPKSNTSTEYFN